MQHRNIFSFFSSLILFFSLFIFLFFSLFFSSYVHAYIIECKEEINKLTVTGYGKTKVKAQVSKVNLSIEVKEKKIEDVQQLISTRSEQLIKALKENNAQKINTEQLFITPNYNYKQPQVLIGHTGKMRVSFEADTSEVGKIIAKAMNSGANKVEGITTKPSDEVLKEAKANSLKLASKNALKKASIVLDALDLHQVSITQINIHPESFQTPPRPYFAMSKATDSVGASREFAPKIVATEQEVEVKVTLKILYE